MSDVYPDDSVSHTENMDQRNKRFEKDLQETHDLSTTQTASSLSRPQEVAIAERVRSNVKTYLETEEKRKTSRCFEKNKETK